MATINLKLPYSEEIANEYMEFIDIESMSEKERFKLPKPFLFKYFFEFSAEPTNLTLDEALEVLLHCIDNKDDKKLDIVFNYILNKIIQKVESIVVDDSKLKSFGSKFLIFLLVKRKFNYVEKALSKLGTFSFISLQLVTDNDILYEIFCQEINVFKALISQITSESLKSSFIFYYWKHDHLFKRDDFDEKMILLSKCFSNTDLYIRDYLQETFENKESKFDLLIEMGIDPDIILSYLLKTDPSNIINSITLLNDKEEKNTRVKVLKKMESLLKKGSNANRFIEEAIDHSDKRVLVLFMKNGANPNSFVSNGNRLVHECVMKGDVEKLEILANFGANMNFLNKKKVTAIICSIMQDCQDSFKVLMKHGANPSKRSHITIEKALDKCAELSHSTKYLVASVIARNFFIKALNKYGMDIPLIPTPITKMVQTVSSSLIDYSYRGSYETGSTGEASIYIYDSLKKYFTKDKW